MKTVLFRIAGVLFIALILFSFDMPQGWFKAGSKPECYEMGTDKGAGMNGGNAATIKSIDKRIKGFGTLMQTSLPDKFAGNRVRLTGYIKAINVDDKAGLWFRVDGRKGMLAFDNMMDRPVKGTKDWTKCEIVLDVDSAAKDINYGALLVGTGQIWFDKIQLEIVDKTVPTTSNLKVENKPENLDFEK